MKTVLLFYADYILDDQQVSVLCTETQSFLGTWQAHGRPINGGFEVRDNVFLIFKTDEQTVPLSGCSRDTLFRFVENIGANIGVNFLNRQVLPVQSNGEIEILKMDEIQHYISKNKAVDLKVFNVLVKTEQELDETFLLPIQQSWMKKYLIEA